MTSAIGETRELGHPADPSAHEVPMIEFSCDCGNRLRTEDSQRGESVTCPACGKHQWVPADEGNRVTTEPANRPTGIAEDAPPRRRHRFDDGSDERRRA